MVPALTAAGWGTAAPSASGYARTDPESVAQIAQVWGCPALLLLPADGPAAPAQPQLPASAIEASMLESALTKAVVSTSSTAAPHIQRLSSWFASLPAEEQVAVSRVLQVGAALHARHCAVAHPLCNWPGKALLPAAINSLPPAPLPQGATGRLSVQRRKAGPAGQAETAAQPAAAKPTPLADRTNHQHAARSISKVVKVLAHQAFAQYAKKKGKV